MNFAACKKKPQTAYTYREGLNCLNRLVAVFVLMAFLLTNQVYLPACAADILNSLPESQQKFSASDLSRILIPNDLGSIEERYVGKSPKTVFIVQDAHAVQEAQKNIKALIEYFQKEHGLSLVAVEGAASKLDPFFLRSFPDASRLQKTLKIYLDSGELTGVSAAAILNEKQGLYWGVENWALYVNGLELYQKAMRQKGQVSEQLKVQRSALEIEKESEYSKRLLSIDKALRHFEREQVDLEAVLKKLTAVKRPDAGSGLLALVEEMDRMKEDTSASEIEVKRIAEVIRLAEDEAGAVDELKILNQAYQSFQTGERSSQAFALDLLELLNRSSALSKMPDLSGIKTLLKSLSGHHGTLRDLEGTQLLKEFEHYALEVKESLLTTERERILERQSRLQNLLEKLASLELTRDEWEEFKLLNKSSLMMKPLEGKLKPFSDFYENAEKRDSFFLKNLKYLMTRYHQNTAMLVAGGFHAKGLTQQLKSQEISYWLISPKISMFPKQSSYPSLMTGKVAWGHYYQSEKGLVSLQAPFMRFMRDALLKQPQSDAEYGGRLLKSWRDQMIRDKADQKKITEVRRYTDLIDEVFESEKKPEWQIKTEGFLQSLRHLESRGQLSEKNIVRLLHPSTMGAAVSVGLASDQLPARLLRFQEGLPKYKTREMVKRGFDIDFNISSYPDGRRSEVRSGSLESSTFTKEVLSVSDFRKLARWVHIYQQSSGADKSRLGERVRQLLKVPKTELNPILHSELLEIWRQVKQDVAADFSAVVEDTELLRGRINSKKLYLYNAAEFTQIAAALMSGAGNMLAAFVHYSNQNFIFAHVQRVSQSREFAYELLYHELLESLKPKTWDYDAFGRDFKEGLIQRIVLEAMTQRGLSYQVMDPVYEMMREIVGRFEAMGISGQELKEGLVLNRSNLILKIERLSAEQNQPEAQFFKSLGRLAHQRRFISAAEMMLRLEQSWNARKNPSRPDGRRSDRDTRDPEAPLGPDGRRSEVRAVNVYQVVDSGGREIGSYKKRIPKEIFEQFDHVTIRGFTASDAIRLGGRSWYYINARKDLLGVPVEAYVEKGLVTRLKFIKDDDDEEHEFSRIYTRLADNQRSLIDVFPFELKPKKMKALDQVTVTHYNLDKSGSLMIGGRHWARFEQYPNASVEIDIDHGLVTKIRVLNKEGKVIHQHEMVTIWDKSGVLQDVISEKMPAKKLKRLNHVTLKGLRLSMSSGALKFGRRHWTSLHKHKGAPVEVDIEEGLVVEIRVFNSNGKRVGRYAMGRIYKDGKLIDVLHRQITPKKFKTFDGVVLRTNLDPRGGLTLAARSWITLKKYSKAPIEADIKKGFITEVRILDQNGAVLKRFPFYEVHDESGRIIDVFPRRFTPQRREQIEKKAEPKKSSGQKRISKVVLETKEFPAEGHGQRMSREDLARFKEGVLRDLSLDNTSGALRIGGRQWIAMTRYRGYAAEADVENGFVVTVRVLDPEGEVIETVDLPRVYENDQFIDVIGRGQQNKMESLNRNITIKKLRLTKEGALSFAGQYWGMFSAHPRASIEIDIKDKRIVQVRILNPDGSVLEKHESKKIFDMKGDIVGVFYGTVLPAQLKRFKKVRIENLEFNGTGTLFFGGRRMYGDGNFPNAKANVIYDGESDTVYEVRIVADGAGRPVDYLYKGSDLKIKRRRMNFYSERGRVYEAAMKLVLEALGESWEYQKAFYEDARTNAESSAHIPDFTSPLGEVFATETLRFTDAKFNLFFGKSLDEYIPIILEKLRGEWDVEPDHPKPDDFVKKVVFELVYLGLMKEANLQKKIERYQKKFSENHPEFLEIHVSDFWDVYAPRLEAAGRGDLIEFLRFLKDFHYKKERVPMLGVFRAQLAKGQVPKGMESAASHLQLDFDDLGDWNEKDGRRSEVRRVFQQGVIAAFKGLETIPETSVARVIMGAENIDLVEREARRAISEEKVRDLIDRENRISRFLDSIEGAETVIIDYMISETQFSEWKGDARAKLQAILAAARNVNAKSRGKIMTRVIIPDSAKGQLRQPIDGRDGSSVRIDISGTMAKVYSPLYAESAKLDTEPAALTITRRRIAARSLLSDELASGERFSDRLSEAGEVTEVSIFVAAVLALTANPLQAAELLRRVEEPDTVLRQRIKDTFALSLMSRVANRLAEQIQKGLYLQQSA